MKQPRQYRCGADDHEPDDCDGKERGDQLTNWVKLNRGQQSLYIFNDLAEIEWALRIGCEQIVNVEWDVRDVMLVATLERLKARAEELDRKTKIPALRAGRGVSIRVAWQAKLRPFLGYQPVELVRELAEFGKVVFHSSSRHRVTPSGQHGDQQRGDTRERDAISRSKHCWSSPSSRKNPMGDEIMCLPFA